MPPTLLDILKKRNPTRLKGRRDVNLASIFILDFSEDGRHRYLSGYLRSEAEEALRLHHLLQHVALGAGRAVVLVHDAVLQVDVVHRQAHVVLLAVDDGYRVQLVHHL